MLASLYDSREEPHSGSEAALPSVGVDHHSLLRCGRISYSSKKTFHTEMSVSMGVHEAPPISSYAKRTRYCFRNVWSLPYILQTHIPQGHRALGKAAENQSQKPTK
ncbi:unnamed protein product [Coccothraustes coccothraustes]